MVGEDQLTANPSSPSDSGTNLTEEIEQNTSTPQSTATPIPSPTPVHKAYYLPPYLPDSFQQDVHFPLDWERASNFEQSLVSIDYGGDYVISDWVFVLVVPFPTVLDSVSSDQLIEFWNQGNSTGISFETLVLDEQSFHAMQYLLGESINEWIKVVPAETIQEFTWNNSNTWAIIPFEQLNPKWKVIQIDQDSPIHHDFQPSRYLLTAPLSIMGGEGEFTAKLDLHSIFPSSNRDPDKLAVVALTGVTALVRATGIEMEMNGTTYPAMDIGDWLRDADILHINNEVPFAEDCPNPAVYYPEGLVFCSRTKYIELLEDIGTDIIELSGDHFQDWGIDAMLYTLDLYQQRDWKIYGGGINLAEGQKPLLVEVKGNKLAFIGCNAKQLGYARASETNPGAVHCDMEYVTQQIQDLRSEGYLPIVTFQHEEVYTYEIHPKIETEFLIAAEAGAIIVSGSQAHQPHAMEFKNDAFIHYGLGNLFFDQYLEGVPTRQAFIDRHIFYGNRHISTELLTIMFVDFARSRPMTPAEREDLLNTVFNLSRWNYP